MIKVIFRKFKDDQIIALFPNIKDNNTVYPYDNKRYILSYMKIGQHGAAHVDLIKDLNQCNSKEILAGVKMLHDTGYKNIIVKA